MMVEGRLPDEPSDEDLWLEAIARRVAADAGPLFEIAWLWLGRQALEKDQDEPAAPAQ